MVRVAVTEHDFRKAEARFVRAKAEGCDCIALLGLDNVFIVLLCAPETRGQPLMDDE